MNARARRLAVLVGTSLALGGTAAHAQTNEATATELFDVGRDLMKAGDFTAACPKLAASLRLDPKVGTLARLAECEEHTGRMASAHAHWARALDLAVAAHDSRVAHIRSEMQRVDALVAKVDIELQGVAPPGLALRIDGIDVGAASLGVKLPVEVGKHTLTVTADGKKPWTSDFESARPGSLTVVSVPALDDAPLAPVVVAEPAPSLAPVPPPRAERPLRVPGVLMAGVGVLGMTAGVLVGVLVAKKDYDDSNSGGGCSTSPNRCTTSGGEGQRKDAVTAGNVATGVFVGGAVLAAAGVTLALLPPKRERAPGAGAVHLGLGPRQVALEVTLP